MLASVLRSCVACIVVVACAVVAMFTVTPHPDRLQTEDRNGDGRPDVWRMFDQNGQSLSVAIDTNFDDRPDVEEYYTSDALVRREIDRNLNDQVDIIQEFDPLTHQQTRSIEDTNDDGTADVLILFRDGQPVFSEYVPSRASSFATTRLAPYAMQSEGQPRPLMDPFRDKATMRSLVSTHRARESIGMSTSGGVPKPRVSPLHVLLVCCSITLGLFSPTDFAVPSPPLPRGPPVTLNAQ